MSQTSYSRNYGERFAGQLSDGGRARQTSKLNAEGASLPAGVAVVEFSEGKIDLMDATNDVVAGIVVHTMATDVNGLSASSSNGELYRDGQMVPVLEEGAIMVRVEEAIAVGDPVYVRFASGAGGSQLGAFRNDADTATCRLLKGAYWITGASGAGVAELYFSKAAQYV